MSIKSKLQSLVLADLLEAPTLSNTVSFANDCLIRSVVKKFAHASDESHNAAVRGFLERNASLTPFDFADVKDEEIRRSLIWAKGYFHQLFLDSHARAFYEPNPEKGSFGPGSSFLVTHSDMAGKYEQLTYTSPELLSFFLRAHPWVDDGHRAVLSHLVRTSRRVLTAKLTTVPKTDTVDRCIAVEPSLNMFCQQAIRVDLEGILARIGLDVSTQPDIQRQLARKGSLDDSFSTIDLSAASDSISHSFMKWFLPPDLLYWLEVCRSPTLIYKGKTVDLRMISTMGNATTFPLQTLLFTAVCVGCYHIVGLKPVLEGPKRNLGVFGDDIIIDPSCFDIVVRVLRAIGFKTNLDKTFRSGGFKESCGEDFYWGTNVRPVFIARLNTEADYYSAYNRLLRWAKEFSPLPRTLAFLYEGARRKAKTSRKGQVLLVPHWEDLDAGIHARIRGRYNALRAKPQYRRVRYDDDRIMWLAVGGYCQSRNDQVVVPVRAHDLHYRVERCFSPCYEIGNPRPLAGINSLFGLGSRLL